mmetsp:Transcript_115683/g.369121  ORF Transcript_115683/g.369121 Transcript_115683/m.369121 type:complete len:214 (+) Transcript_115683:937-1578(+)
MADVDTRTGLKCQSSTPDSARPGYSIKAVWSMSVTPPLSATVSATSTTESLTRMKSEYARAWMGPRQMLEAPENATKTSSTDVREALNPMTSNDPSSRSHSASCTTRDQTEARPCRPTTTTVGASVLLHNRRGNLSSSRRREKRRRPAAPESCSPPSAAVLHAPDHSATVPFGRPALKLEGTGTFRARPSADKSSTPREVWADGGLGSCRQCL